MSNFGASHIVTIEIEQQKLSWNSNGHNFYHWGPIQAYNISRRSQLNIGRSREIKIVITFNSDVRFKHITYGDARNWNTKDLKKFKWSWHLTRMSNFGASHIVTLETEQRKLSWNSNGHNFSHGCPIQAYNISIRSKLNIGNSRGIQIVITIHTDVWFGDIIYRDARNWTTEPLGKLKWS